jgi:hypothetical protein
VDNPRPETVVDLVGRYADAVLRADTARFASLWTDDAEWAVAGSEPIRGRPAIVEMFARSRSRFRLCVQEVMSGYADPPDEGGTVEAHWQVRELQWRPDGTGGELIGVYHDTVQPVAGIWRFARRRFELVYRGPLDLPGRVYDPAAG